MREVSLDLLIPRYSDGDVDIIGFSALCNHCFIPGVSPISSLAPLTAVNNPRLHAAIQEQARASGRNPAKHILGRNPFTSALRRLGPQLDQRTLWQLPSTSSNPSLAEKPSIPFVGERNIVLVEKLHSGSIGWIYKARWVFEDATDAPCVVKVYRGYCSTAQAAFEHERAAYNHLIHCGAHARAVRATPDCYGWLSTHDLDLGGVAMESGPFPALVLEFIGGSPVAVGPFEHAFSEQAMVALQAIHHAHLQHNQIRVGHLFVDRGSWRVVILDFAHSSFIGSPEISASLTTRIPPNRVSLITELGSLWEMIFAYILPNQCLGVTTSEPDHYAATRPPIASPLGMLTILSQYPQLDLFDYEEKHSTCLPLISPLPQVQDPQFSEEFKAAARCQLRRTYEVPFGTMIGPNPFVAPTDYPLDTIPTLQPHPASVPPLACIPQPILDWLTDLNPTGNNSSWKVVDPSDRGKHCLIKIFRDDSERDVDEPYVPGWDWERPIVSFEMFEMERSAYARLAYHELPEAGVVPRCYGWFPFDSDAPDVPSSVTLWCREFANTDGTGTRPGAHALLLEFIEDAEPLSPRHLSPSVNRQALFALQLVHRAFVQHNDIDKRNILVTSSGRVVLVDFDRASLVAAPDNGGSAASDSQGGRPDRQSLLDELATMYRWIFAYLYIDRFLDSDLPSPRPTAVDACA